MWTRKESVFQLFLPIQLKSMWSKPTLDIGLWLYDQKINKAQMHIFQNIIFCVSLQEESLTGLEW